MENNRIANNTGVDVYKQMLKIICKSKSPTKNYIELQRKSEYMQQLEN